MQLFFGAHLILFSFSCQFDLAFWAFLVPFAVAGWPLGGPWRRGAASCDGAAPVTLHCLVVLSKPIEPYTHSKDLFELR